MQLPTPLSIPQVLALDVSTMVERTVVERRLLGRSRRMLADMVAFEASPTRIVETGRGGIDLEDHFPDAVVRQGDPPTHTGVFPEWSGWPDLLWCDYALDAAATVDDLWYAMPAGALIAVVDAHDAPTRGMGRWMRDTLALVPDPRRLAALRQAFVPLHVSVLEQQGGLWRSLVFVGRKGVRLGASATA